MGFLWSYGRFLGSDELRRESLREPSILFSREASTDPELRRRKRHLRESDTCRGVGSVCTCTRVCVRAGTRLTSVPKIATFTHCLRLIIAERREKGTPVISAFCWFRFWVNAQFTLCQQRQVLPNVCPLCPTSVQLLPSVRELSAGPGLPSTDKEDEGVPGWLSRLSARLQLRS